ncbi:MAG TPA: GNAT family protein [Ktedonobacteraceae bacterium]|nr:GNAT family protein [Ktedonobacteraceae bacterium]
MLKGEKIILRAMKREDLQRQWMFNNDIEIEILGGGDPPEPQAIERLEAEFDENTRKGGRDGTNFAIEADGKYIGACGLFHFNEIARTCEMGIGIGDRAYWGRGYGRDAVKLLLDYAFRQRNLHKVWLTVNANNERAIRSYRACGFVEEGRLRKHVWSNGQYIDFVYMGVLRDEWATVHSAQKKEQLGES